MSDVSYLSVTVMGQFYYLEHRRKAYREYEVEVELPVEQMEVALWYIKKFLVGPAIQEKYPELAFAGVRTCEIVTHLPERIEGDEVVHVSEFVEDIMVSDKIVSDEFSDIEDIDA